MRSIVGRLKAPKPADPFVAEIFHGIDRSTDESKLPAGGTSTRDCYTYKGVNFEIVNGNVTCRKNYEVVNIDGVNLGDGYTYKFKSLIVQPGDASDTILAGAEVYDGATLLRCVLLKRNFEFTDAWAVVTGGASHALGSGLPIYFGNADFSFINRYGDFFETGAEVLATQMTNGADPQAFYYNGYLYAVKSDGWASVTADAGTDLLTLTGGFPDGTAVELCSTTKQMPGGLTAGATYYTRDLAGDTFKLAAAAGGSAINITSNGANVLIRENTAASIWYACTPSYTAGNIGTASAIFADGDVVEFKSPTFTLPKELVEGQKYYVVSASGTTFKVSASFGGTALVLSTNGSNVQIRKCQQRWNDAPLLETLAFDNGRAWGNIGNAQYYDGGYYDEKGNPWDWWTQPYAGIMHLDTWDGDTVLAFVTLSGQKFAFKKQSCWYIGGTKPPYTQRQVFTAKGTISRRSICVWNGMAFYATTEGVQRFDGTTSASYLTDAIKGIWNPDNADCVFTVVGDFLHIYAYLTNPVTGVAGYGKLVVDLNNGNVFYHDMAYGTPATLTVDAVLDPSFTLLKSGVTAPQWLFAMGDKLYKYGASVPSSGAAAMTYYIPSSDLGDASLIKYMSWIYITGKGGTCAYTPILDNAEGTALSNFELPAVTAVVKVPASGISARILGWKVQNVGGDPIEIHSHQPDFRAVKN